MKNNIFQLIMLTLIIALIEGCQGNTPKKEDKTSNLTIGIVQKEIKKGMSQADVVSVLGSPNIVTKEEANTEVWIYDKISSTVDYSNTNQYATLVLLSSSSKNTQVTTTQKTLTIIIKFKKGKVYDYKYHEVLSSTLLILGLSLIGCNSGPQITPKKSQLEWRQLQVKSYDDVKEIIAMKAILSALQDEGYTVESTNMDLGLIVASMTIDSDGGCSGIGNSYICEKSIVTTVNATVQPNNNKGIKIRLSISKKGMSGKGGVMWSRQEYRKKIYQSLFDKISKSIFLQKENL